MLPRYARLRFFDRHKAALLVALALVLGGTVALGASADAGKKQGPPAGIATARQFSEAVRWAADQVKPAVVIIENGKTKFSGVLIDPNGYILTSYRAVQNQTGVSVEVKEGGKNKSYTGKIVASDRAGDLALVQIEGQDFPYARLGDSKELVLAEWVLAVGIQRGMSQSVSAGIVSAPMGKVPESGTIGTVPMLQTTVAADTGNIGGPLVNLDGEVVGIVSFIPSRRREVKPAAGKGAKPATLWSEAAYEGVAFAVPSLHIKEVLPQLAAGVQLADAPKKAKPPAGTATARRLGQGIQWVAEQVKPAVVTLRRPQGRGPLCSGVLIDPNGHILTTHSALAGAAAVEVRLAGNPDKSHEGKIVAADEAANLAVVKIEGEQFPCARIGDSGAARVGDWVLSVGAPFDLEQSITMGIVSTLKRKRTGVAVDMLQTSAPANQNNPGSPLVNADGEVIGIAASTLGSFKGIAFAVPSQVFKEKLLPKLAGFAPPPPRPAPLPENAALIRQLSEVYRWAADQVAPAVIWTGGGCGVIVSPDGYIVTNNHVIGARKIGSTFKVRTPSDGTAYEAKVISKAPRDIGLLKIEGNDLPHARLGDSDAMRVGDWVMSIGGPFTLTQTVTEGMITGKDRGWPAKKLQHDSPVNPGNSGGVVISLEGEVIGINGTTNGTYVSYGTPSNYVKQIMDCMKSNTPTGRGLLGVVSHDVTGELAREKQLSVAEGALIAEVAADGPAQKAGLEPGDCITHFNGFALKNAAELDYVVKLSKPGTTAPVRVLRKGQVVEVKVEVGEKAVP